MEYFLHIAVLFCIFAVLSVALDLLAGHTGLLSLAQAGLFGLGAYTSALLTLHVGFPFALAMVCGMVVAVIFSFVVSIPSLRLHDDYFVIATFGFQMILFSIFNNWLRLTGGPTGIPGIPQPSFLGWQMDSKVEFLGFALVFVIGTCFVIWRLSTSPFGRVLRAIREDETFAKALGNNTFRFKVTAFAISAAFSALAGTLYAHYLTYIDPSSFTVMESILVLSMVIVGGSASRGGPVLGALILITLPEVLRFVGLPSTLAANSRQIIYGSLLVVMMLLRPRGIAGHYDYER